MSPREVGLREVLPRDGFQDLGQDIPYKTKVAIIQVLWDAGLRWIEASSMVHPRRVPQFRDAEGVVAAVSTLEGLRCSVFVPNQRGLRRALDAGVDEVSLALACTDSLSRENFAMTRDRAFDEIGAMTVEASQAGCGVSVTLGGAFGCPFEGAVAIDTVLELVRSLRRLPTDSLFLADTIGVARPEQVGRLIAETCEEVDGIPVGVHLHGGAAAVESVLEGLEAGASLVDCALTGLGGCPFVPSAPGNVSTELTVAAMERRGFSPPVSSSDLDIAARRVGDLLDQVKEGHAAAHH